MLKDDLTIVETITHLKNHNCKDVDDAFRMKVTTYVALTDDGLLTIEPFVVCDMDGTRVFTKSHMLLRESGVSNLEISLSNIEMSNMLKRHIQIEFLKMADMLYESFEGVGKAVMGAVKESVIKYVSMVKEDTLGSYDWYMDSALRAFGTAYHYNVETGKRLTASGEVSFTVFEDSESVCSGSENIEFDNLTLFNYIEKD